MAPAQSPAWRKQFRMQFKKTKLCRFYAMGQCHYGEDCCFAHSQTDLEVAPDLTKTALCQGWQNGGCPLPAEKCPYAHGTWELRLTPAFTQVNLSRRTQGVLLSGPEATLPQAVVSPGPAVHSKVKPGRRKQVALPPGPVTRPLTSAEMLVLAMDGEDGLSGSEQDSEQGSQGSTRSGEPGSSLDEAASLRSQESPKAHPVTPDMRWQCPPYGETTIGTQSPRLHVGRKGSGGSYGARLSASGLGSPCSAAGWQQVWGDTKSNDALVRFCLDGLGGRHVGTEAALGSQGPPSPIPPPPGLGPETAPQPPQPRPEEREQHRAPWANLFAALAREALSAEPDATAKPEEAAGAFVAGPPGLELGVATPCLFAAQRTMPPCNNAYSPAYVTLIETMSL